MAKPNIYVSIDIEADGPIPGINAMLNFGAAAFRLDGDNPREPIATFEANLERPLNTTADPDTMTFWAENRDAWDYVTKDPRPPSEVMEDFYEWSVKLGGRPVMVVYPTYDFMFMRWYLVRYLGVEKAKLYGFSALDMKSLGLALLDGVDFRGVSKPNMAKQKKHWFKGHPPHDHTGLSDAIGQGMMFVSMMQDLGRMK